MCIELYRYSFLNKFIRNKLGLTKTSQSYNNVQAYKSIFKTLFIDSQLELEYVLTVKGFEMRILFLFLISSSMTGIFIFNFVPVASDLHFFPCKDKTELVY